MSYETIDNVIYAWSARHGVQLSTTYQDSEVRTVSFAGKGRERGQIWIDPPSNAGDIVVHVAVYCKRGKDNMVTELLATRSDLDSVLEYAYALVADWLVLSS